MEKVKEMVENALEAKPLKDVICDLQSAVENTLKYFGNLDEKDLPGYLRAFKLLKENKDLLDSIHGVVETFYKGISYDKLPPMFEEMGIDSMKLAGRNFILNAKLQASISIENRPVGFAWLRSNGGDVLIQETVNAQSLTSFLKTKIEDEGISPGEDDGIKLHTQKYISVRKA